MAVLCVNSASVVVVWNQDVALLISSATAVLGVTFSGAVAKQRGDVADLLELSIVFDVERFDIPADHPGKICSPRCKRGAVHEMNIDVTACDALHAVECIACGHIDAHLVNYCPVCGRATQEVVDVGEAILPWVVRRDIETFYVKDDAEFDKIGNIAALLRYRTEKVTPISTAVAEDLQRAGAEYPGRLRKFARR